MRSAFAVLLMVIAFVGLTACGSDPEAGAETSAYRYNAPPADASIYEDTYEDPEVVAQQEWEAQEGEAWDEFDSGYLAGWEAGCDVAFEGSPDGSLYDQGVEYTVDECYDLVPYDASSADVPFDVPGDPYYEGELLGESDGCVAAFDELSSYGVLNWGEDSYDEGVCP